MCNTFGIYTLYIQKTLVDDFVVRISHDVVINRRQRLRVEPDPNLAETCIMRPDKDPCTDIHALLLTLSRSLASASLPLPPPPPAPLVAPLPACTCQTLLRSHSYACLPIQDDIICLDK